MKFLMEVYRVILAELNAWPRLPRVGQRFNSGVLDLSVLAGKKREKHATIRP